MAKQRYRLPLKAVAAALSIGCFLAFSLGAVTHTIAAEPWETWPPKKTTPGEETPTSDAAAKAGEEAGTKTYAGLSAGTWGWIALGVGGLAAILLVAGGGGDGTTAAPTHP